MTLATGAAFGSIQVDTGKEATVKAEEERKAKETAAAKAAKAKRKAEKNAKKDIVLQTCTILQMANWKKMS